MATRDPTDDKARDVPRSIAETIRASPSRKKILKLLEKKPGRNPHQIANELRMHVNAVRFHIHRLEEVGLVETKKGLIGRERVCFTQENVHLWDNRSTRFLFGRGPPRTVASYLVDRPGSSIRQIAEDLRISPHTVRAHLRQLEANRLVQRVRIERSVFYHPNDELVEWMAQMTLLDDHVDHDPKTSGSNG